MVVSADKGPKHEVRALLRAHLSAAARLRHQTRRCPVCHRLLALALENGADVPAWPVRWPGRISPSYYRISPSNYRISASYRSIASE